MSLVLGLLIDAQCSLSTQVEEPRANVAPGFTKSRARGRGLGVLKISLCGSRRVDRVTGRACSGKGANGL